MSNPANSITILTGAGISAESGLPTFRDANGLWEGHRFEDVATPEAFERNPALVHRFYNMRRAALHTVTANAAHEAIARLQGEFRGQVHLITQNVDDLHERGGSPEVIHMHGELTKIRCTHCADVRLWTGDLEQTTPCPACGDAGGLRPDIVWFGETPYHMESIEQLLATTKLFVAIGTSGNVYPAAGFVRLAKLAGALAIEINVAGTEVTFAFDKRMTGPATEEVPKLVDWVLSSQA